MSKRLPSTTFKAVTCMVAALACIALLFATGCSPESTTSRSSSQKISSQDVSDTMASSSSTAASEESSSSSTEEKQPSEAAPSESMDQVTADLESVCAASGMDVGAAVIDLETGGYAGYYGSQQMASASMIKLAIAATFLDRVKDGTFSLDDYYTLQASDIVGGTGTLGGLGAGAQVTYGEILNKMISVSDNTGANVLINAVGMDAVNTEASELGLAATQLNRLMMDTDAIAAGIENYTSADDVALLLRMAYNGTLVDAESSALVVQALEQQEDYNGILSGLPSGVVFAHKTGSLSNVRHDGGIVEGEHPYVVVALCGGPGFSEQGAYSTMSQIGSVTYADIVG